MATAISGAAKPSRRKVGQAHLSYAYRKAGGEMAVVMKRFFCHEKGNHDEAWYYLARDTESGAVYIEHEWAERGNFGSKRIGVAEFLSGPSMTARDNLLELIGTLVVETGDAPRP
jgi:hypothetical protein